jgi:hypothetical protein
LLLDGAAKSVTDESIGTISDRAIEANEKLATLNLHFEARSNYWKIITVQRAIRGIQNEKTPQHRNGLLEGRGRGPHAQAGGPQEQSRPKPVPRPPRSNRLILIIFMARSGPPNLMC